jgi:outer membrane protein
MQQPLKKVLSAVVLLACALDQPAPAQDSGRKMSLTLSQATDLAVKNNLQTVLGRERVLQARGERGVSLSSLLPNLSGSAYQGNQTSNLSAMGLTKDVFPGLAPFIGPYSVFDARIRLTQTVFNLGAFRRYQAGRYGVELAGERERFATQQVITATALAYLSVLEGEQAVESAKANVQLAQTLFDLAVSQRNAGLATGLDVTRAETRLANQQVQLAQSQTSLDTARLELMRVVGAPLASDLTLAEPMKFSPEPRHDGVATVQMALTERSDLKVAAQQLRIAKAQHKAAVAGWAPTIAVGGDYGSSGIKPNDTNFPTRSIGVRVDIPIFDGGRTHSEVQIAVSLERQSEAQIRDLKAAVEKDVRQALDNLVTREAQVKAAQKMLSLATRELELARDRFKNGVADNIEVVNAQTALENARQSLVMSLAQFNIARLNLASATGRAQDFRL